MGIQFKYMHCPSCIMERKSHKNRLKGRPIKIETEAPARKHNSIYFNF